MHSKNVKRLVVDTSVALAAGGKEATSSDVEVKDLVSINCTKFLKTFRDDCSHRIVMTAELFKEWNQYRSKFTLTWLKTMIAKNRYYYVKSPENQALCNKIEQTATSENEVKEMWDDFRLLEAALKSDQTIISLDEAIRRLFAQASQCVDEIRDIVWVNPDQIENEKPLDWLQNGAPPEEHRKLRVWEDTSLEK